MSHLLHPTQVCAVYRISAQTFRKLRQRYPLTREYWAAQAVQP